MTILAAVTVVVSNWSEERWRHIIDPRRWWPEHAGLRVLARLKGRLDELKVAQQH